MVVYASVAVSLDGYIDDTSSHRLLLSSEEDWNEVKRLRAECDAVLVGAGTVRSDNPALVTRDEALRAKRRSAGKPEDPTKVTISSTGEFNLSSKFFTEGDGEKIIVLPADLPKEQIDRLQSIATLLISDENTLTPPVVLRLLAKHGIRTLFIEGGTKILTQFLASGTVNYLRMAVAPFFVGESGAPRFVHTGKFPHHASRRMHLLGVKSFGDMAVMEYALGATAEDYERMTEAIELSKSSPRSEGAYSVGAVIVTEGGEKFTGYSRETSSDNHAEEEAILKALEAGCSLKNATIYTSMEPCSTRKSKTKSCSTLIIEHALKRVVFASYEPDTFVVCHGEYILRKAGIEVTPLIDMARKVHEVNAHIVGEK